MANTDLVDWIGPQPKDPSPILYFGGYAYPPALERWLCEFVGWKFRCATFAHVGKGKADECLEINREFGVRLFLDSGAFTLQKQKATKLEIMAFAQRYVQYLKVCRFRRLPWDFYVTLDYVRDAKVAQVMTDVLLELGVRPTPVYHGDASLDYFRRYVDQGYKLVGIAKLKGMSPDHQRRYYSQVFDLAVKHGVSLHGFAVTGETMFEYPWYSVDSTTWFASCKYGEILIHDPRRNKFPRVHITEGAAKSDSKSWHTMPESSKKAIIADAASMGLDFDKMKGDGTTGQVHRAAYNAKLFLRLIESRGGRTTGVSKWATLL